MSVDPFAVGTMLAWTGLGVLFFLLGIPAVMILVFATIALGTIAEVHMPIRTWYGVATMYFGGLFLIGYLAGM